MKTSGFCRRGHREKHISIEHGSDGKNGLTRIRIFHTKPQRGRPQRIACKENKMPWLRVMAFYEGWIFFVPLCEKQVRADHRSALQKLFVSIRVIPAIQRRAGVDNVLIFIFAFLRDLSGYFLCLCMRNVSSDGLRILWFDSLWENTLS